MGTRDETSVSAASSARISVGGALVGIVCKVIAPAIVLVLAISLYCIYSHPYWDWHTGERDLTTLFIRSEVTEGKTVLMVQIESWSGGSSLFYLYDLPLEVAGRLSDHIEEPSSLPFWSRLHARPFEQLEATNMLTEFAVGWPAPMWWGAIGSVMEPVQVESATTVWVGGEEYIIPLRPIWWGVTINLTLAIVLVVAVITARRALMMMLRRRKGRCPNCGYDLRSGASGMCPECGRQNVRAWTYVFRL